MQHGSLLSIPNIPTYPSEDACNLPARGCVHPRAADHNPEVWYLVVTPHRPGSVDAEDSKLTMLLLGVVSLQTVVRSY